MNFIRTLLVLAAGIAAASAGAAQFPTKPIRLVIGFAPGSPEQFGAYMKSEMAKWAKVIKAAGIKVQ